MIPRLLHQIWLSGGELPPPLKRNTDKLRSLNPGWDHRLWTDKQAIELLARCDDEIARSYYRIDPRYGAARADLLRHLIIYRHGGVYCDIKSGFSRPLDNVLHFDDEYILSRLPSLHKELPYGELLTHFVIAAPRHPFSAAVIGKIVRNIKGYRPASRSGATASSEPPVPWHTRSPSTRCSIERGIGSSSKKRSGAITASTTITCSYFRTTFPLARNQWFRWA